ncbi:hypothetical protein DB30_00207 [Enhygromyxa salina]|uniref:Lipoprotein n=1 Tax=Enhygromyxa salina TaxID=215803 RepID=A0A0C2DFV3_9BACT|nr:hypothetical protein [Enhygromyxa salina]KIG18522.1 hypothetical protein DB30_00207 [Enhygromyxa salina]
MRHRTYAALAGLSMVLGAGACTKRSDAVVAEAAGGQPAMVTVEQPGQATASLSAAASELDRTIWDCEWSVAVFWGPHWHRAHRDVAMAAMGGGGLFSREDYELSYGPDQGFRAAIRHREYPNGQRNPEDLDDAQRGYRYTIHGDRLTIHADHWKDGPLECVRGCYDQAFIDFMDARYQMQTSAEVVAEKMRAPECGG